MVKMHPPKPTRSNVCTSQRRVHPQKKRDEKTKGKREHRLEEGYKVRHAVGYIPCLATISIGQDRKYTIEGSSATDKDYPIKKNGKQANQYLSDKIHRLKLERVCSKHKNEENELKRQYECLLFYSIAACAVSGLGEKNDAFLVCFAINTRYFQSKLPRSCANMHTVSNQ